MRIPRFYLDTEFKSGVSLSLSEHVFQHAVKVLRLNNGAIIQLFNGHGQEALAELISIEKKSATATVIELLDNQAESPLKTHLGLGVSKGERMDYAIQKAVELGVTQITPLITERTVVRFDEKRQQKRLEHWQGVIISACEQCGRATLPVLNNFIKLDNWLSQRDEHDLKLTLNPHHGKSLKDISYTQQNIDLLIGPEGGLSEYEVQQAREKGFEGIQLGPRILRTETAVVTSLSAIQTTWGDLA